MFISIILNMETYIIKQDDSYTLTTKLFSHVQLGISVLKQHSTMEDMFWRFPHIGDQILKKLSNKSIVNSKKLARTWNCFIKNAKFYQKRIRFVTFQKKRRLRFEMSLKKSNKHGQTPLHQAAMYGQLSKCKEIIDIVENKNPKDKEGLTPLHLAAEYCISRLDFQIGVN